jgi:predicted nucleic acid-binding protein
VIVVDTGALVALIDADDHHHRALREQFQSGDGQWVVPWAVLPEVDYLIARHLGPELELAFLEDLAEGRYAVEWGDERDLARARELCGRYAALELGLVDGVVLAIAERLKAEAIATLDLRHFGAVELRVPVRLLPRDA